MKPVIPDEEVLLAWVRNRARQAYESPTAENIAFLMLLNIIKRQEKENNPAVDMPTEKLTHGTTTG